MKFVLFYHSVRSDWNHGNAHFLRGIARALTARGHDVTIFEPHDAWSVQQLVADQGVEALSIFDNAFPDIVSNRFDADSLDLDGILADADVVIAHEWNSPDLIGKLGKYRQRHGGVRLLFHDTHHRMVSEPEAMARFDLSGYDGILAFGAVLADAWARAGWGNAAYVWHEAADITTFRPRLDSELTEAEPWDIIWIGNWGDGERSKELQEYLLSPARRLGARLLVHGVRYPDHALAELSDAGASYQGWIPGPEVPRAFAGAHLTVHVPRRWYRQHLRGIPTIRMFEALACGIPLVSAPWHDDESLFSAGEDYLLAADPAAMERQIDWLLKDEAARLAIAASGRRKVLERHTCAHRAAELEGIIADLDQTQTEIVA